MAPPRDLDATSTLLTCVLVGLSMCACAPHRARIAVPHEVTFVRSVYPRPSGCRAVPVGTGLQQAIDAALPGAALCLERGTYTGALTIPRALTLWGPRDAVILSDGVGTTVHVTGAHTHLLGFTVDGSGGRYDLSDAAVNVEADDVEVAGLRIVRAVYGVLVQRAERAVVRENEITGINEQTLGLRGDAIRLWETRHSVVERNSVEHSRDVVVWYSPNNRVVGNVVRHGRYGTHFMYSSDNLVEGNVYLENVVGLFIMYSHGISVRRNLIAESSGGGGMGLGLKDSGNITVVSNVFVHDTVGVYSDGSPSTNGEVDVFEGNLFRLDETGVIFHASQQGNRFVRNSFRDVATSVAVEGGGDALETHWENNDFDDYQGYDLDGDGIGDVPYELRSLSSDLASRTPALDLLRGSPAMALVDLASHIAPLFESRTILVDRRPRMEPLRAELNDAHRAP